MKENQSKNIQRDRPAVVHKPTEVIVAKDWKEYLGESLLIIFSVFLALFFSEVVNAVNDKKETKQLLRNIRQELVQNKASMELQYKYHLSVLKNIDSAISDIQFQQRIISNEEFHLDLIAPDGVLYRYLDNIAWDVAKNHNISSRVDFKTIALLTRIYNDQARVMKVEDEIARIILSPDSRKTENSRVTLILIKDNYRGWAVDRAQGLINQYSEAIKLLDD